MMEEHFYWCLVMERWVIMGAEDVPKFFAPTIFPSFLPGFVVNYLYKQFGSSTMLAQAKAAGLGRHSEEEIYKLAL